MSWEACGDARILKDDASISDVSRLMHGRIVTPNLLVHLPVLKLNASSHQILGNFVSACWTRADYVAQ